MTGACSGFVPRFVQTSFIISIMGKGESMGMYLITFAFIAFDFLTGLLKAFRKKGFTSSTMREGMFHKAGSLLFMLLGIITEQATLYFDLGINVPITSGICTYIVLMEIGSITENIGQINPKLVPEKIRGYFGKLKE